MKIYAIRNIIDDKLYIGKTINNLKDRWNGHMFSLRKGLNTKLYNAMRKYGINNFEMFVFEDIHNKDKINEREKYWIEVLEPEYNMTAGGDGGWIHDQTGKHWKIKDTSKMKGPKIKTSKSLAGYKKISGGNNYQSKYYIYTPWGKFQTWQEAYKAQTDYKLDAGTIRRYCSSNILLNPKGRRTNKEWRGKFTKDLGFYREKKNV